MRKLLLVGLIAAATILVASTETVSALWLGLLWLIILRDITLTSTALYGTPTRRDASMGRED